VKFLIVFIALLAKNQLPLTARSTRSRTFAWWLQQWQRVRSFADWHRHLRYALVVLLPAAVLAGLFFYSQRWLWGLPTALVEVLLLIYVLSHMGIRQHLDAYRHDLAHGDIQGAYHCAERHLSVPEVALTEDAEHMNEQVARSLLLRWFEYFFLMVFWYMVADVAGVLLAWFSLQYARASDCDQQAWRYLHWLEWGPARLLGLTYGLAGNFVHALPVWQRHLWKLNTQSADVLFEVAHSALKHHGQPEPVPLERQGEVAAQQLDDWQQLHWRSLSIWMVVIAVATIGGVLL
jgi:AmpE protein